MIVELAAVVIVPAFLKSSTLTLIVELLIAPLAVFVNVKILSVASAPEIFPPEITPEFSKDLFIPLKLIVSTWIKPEFVADSVSFRVIVPAFVVLPPLTPLIVPALSNDLFAVIVNLSFAPVKSI